MISLIKKRLNIKFILFTVLIIIFISNTFSVIFIYQSRKALIEEFQKRSEALVKNLALNVEIPLLVENKEELRTLVRNLLLEPEVRGVRILNEKRIPLVEEKKQGKLRKRLKEVISLPVVFTTEPKENITDEMSLFFDGLKIKQSKEREVIGYVEVVFSKARIYQLLNRMRVWIFFAAIIAAIIGACIALLFSYTLIRPIRRLAQAASFIAGGKWDQRLPVTREDELGQLTEAFNQMASSLEKKREELKRTYKELAFRERMAEIGKFSTMIAHELKNPLGIIKGSVDILSKEDTPKHLRETMLSYIADEIRRLNKLIENFLSFARPMPALKSQININNLIEKLTSLLPQDEKKSFSIETQLAELPMIEVDEAQITQALLNLLNNSIDAIKEEGKIILRTKKEDKWVIIEIQDNGCGIPEDVRDRIFEPFFTTKEKGMGLGLSIVKKIVDNHQGIIEIKSNIGEGTVFTIKLPI